MLICLFSKIYTAIWWAGCRGKQEIEFKEVRPSDRCCPVCLYVVCDAVSGQRTRGWDMGQSRLILQHRLYCIDSRHDTWSPDTLSLSLCQNVISDFCSVENTAINMHNEEEIVTVTWGRLHQSLENNFVGGIQLFLISTPSSEYFEDIFPVTGESDILIMSGRGWSRFKHSDSAVINWAWAGPPDCSSYQFISYALRNPNFPPAAACRCQASS